MAMALSLVLSGAGIRAPSAIRTVTAMVFYREMKSLEVFGVTSGIPIEMATENAMDRVVRESANSTRMRAAL
jgi:hypothetical protein